MPTVKWVNSELSMKSAEWKFCLHLQPEGNVEMLPQPVGAFPQTLGNSVLTRKCLCGQ